MDHTKKGGESWNLLENIGMNFVDPFVYDKKTRSSNGTIVN